MVTTSIREYCQAEWSGDDNETHLCSAVATQYVRVNGYVEHVCPDCADQLVTVCAAQRLTR